jgi:hypothetical protein
MGGGKPQKHPVLILEPGGPPWSCGWAVCCGWQTSASPVSVHGNGWESPLGFPLWGTNPSAGKALLTRPPPTALPPHTFVLELGFGRLMLHSVCSIVHLLQFHWFQHYLYRQKFGTILNLHGKGIFKRRHISEVL